MKKTVFAALAATMLTGAGFASIQGCTVSSGGSTNPNFFDGGTTNTGDDDVDQDSGTTTNDSGVTTEDGGTDTNQCGECIAPSCQTQISLCQGNAECVALFQCALSTGDAKTCATQHPNGACLYAQLAACDNVAECQTCQTQCASVNPSCPADTELPECNGGTTDDAGTGTTDGGTTTSDAGMVTVDSCEQCSQTSCSSQEAACAAGSACAQYNSCISACTTADCVTSCGSSNAAGMQASQALGTCAATNCAAQCGQ